MKQIAWMLVAIALAPAAAQGVNDWNRVQGLARGDALEVKRVDGRSAYCAFDGATDASLFCNSGNFFVHRKFQIDRAAVQQVRMAPSPDRVHKIVLASAIVGAVAGAAIPPQNGTPRVVDGAAGGLAGVFAGCFISLPAIFIPGKLVYRQSPAALQPAAPIHAAEHRARFLRALFH
jgi:hypothetical protein